MAHSSAVRVPCAGLVAAFASRAAPSGSPVRFLVRKANAMTSATRSGVADVPGAFGAFSAVVRFLELLSRRPRLSPPAPVGVVVVWG